MSFLVVMKVIVDKYIGCFYFSLEKNQFVLICFHLMIKCRPVSSVLNPNSSKLSALRRFILSSNHASASFSILALTSSDPQPWKMFLFFRWRLNAASLMISWGWRWRRVNIFTDQQRWFLKVKHAEKKLLQTEKTHKHLFFIFTWRI